MAGYLGKISAIVSANTGDFANKLNGSAKDVRKFASTVESTIGSASRAAAASLANIYTPLQKLERAIQAASTMKLSFSGFAGAIKDVDVLKQRLLSLNQRQIDVILKTSGLKDISMFRDALSGLRSQDYNLLVKVGGVEKLKSLRQQIAAGGGEFGILAQTKEASDRVDELRRRIDEAKKAGAEITVGVDASEVKAATAELNRFVAEATKSMGLSAKGPPQRVAARLRGALIEGLAGDETELARRQALAADRDRALAVSGLTARQRRNITERYPSNLDEKIAASQASIGSRSAMLRELDARQAAVKAASAGRTAVAVAPADNIKELTAEYDAAVKSRQKLMAEARKTISTAVGFDVDDSAIQQLASGKMDMFDSAIKQGEILDAVFKQAGAEGAAAIERLAKVLHELGVSDLESTRTQIRQLVSASEQINKPLGDMAKRIASASYETQGALMPAFKRAQSMAESLSAAIKKGVTPASELEPHFAAVEQRLQRTLAAMNRVLEAESKLGGIATGQELQFQSPNVFAAMSRGEDLSRRASALPASALRTSPQIATGLQEAYSVTKRLVAAYAELQSRVASGLDTTDANEALLRLITELSLAQDKAEAGIKVYVDAEAAREEMRRVDRAISAAKENAAFVITGRAQNFDQARSRQSSLESDISGFDRAQRQNFAPLLRRAAVLSQGDDLNAYMTVLDDIDFKVKQQKKLNVSTEEAQAALSAVRKTIDDIQDRASFAITGKVANSGQVESEIARIIGKLDTLDEAGRLAMQPTIAAAVGSLGARDANGNPDIAVMQAALDSLNEEFDKQHKIKVDATEAKSRVDDLRKALTAIAGSLSPTKSPMDYLKESADAARMAVEKVTDATKRSQLQSRVSALSGRISQLAGSNLPPGLIAKEQASIAARLQAVTDDAGEASRPTATDIFGPMVNSSAQRMEALKSQIASTQSAIAALPKPLRDEMLPALNRVRAAFVALGDNPTAKQLRDASREADNLQKRLRRAQDAAKFSGTMRSFINQSAVDRYDAQLKSIKNGLLAVGATASGPVAGAVNRYERALRDAAKAGRLGTQDTKQQMAGLLAQIERVAVASGLMNKQQAAAFARNVASAGKGDVSRMGADKFSLAMNQAIFAVDDFMSSTGGLEFKLRAVSNNITQLGFVIGGTMGLFVGLAAVIAGQGAVAIIKWMNDGRSAEDQTKALNESLARQKSLTEDLAQAFQSLGDSLSRGIFSEAGQRADEFSKQLDEIKKKQNESVRESVAFLDPAVQRERAEQQRIKNKIDSSSDASEIVGLQVKMEQSRQREREAAERAASAPPPDMAKVQERLQNSVTVVADAAALEFEIQTNDPIAAERMRAEGRRRASAIEEPADVFEARRAVKQRMDELAPQIEAGGLEGEAAKRELGALAATLASLDVPLRRSLNEASRQIVEASRGPADGIRQSQEEVAKAIEAGIPGAREFQKQLDDNALKLREAYKGLEQAAEGRDENGNAINDLDQIQARVDAARTVVEELEAGRNAMRERTSQFSYQRIVDPQEQLSSILGRARSNLGDAQFGEGATARRLRELEAEMEDIRRRAEAPDLDAAGRAAIDEAEAALRQQAIAIEATTIALKFFGESLNRASDEVKSNMSAAESRADETRRENLGYGTARTAEEASIAEDARKRQRELEAQSQIDLDYIRAKEEEIKAGPEFERIGEIDRMLGGRGLSADQRLTLNEERRDLLAQVEPRMEELRTQAQEAIKPSTQQAELDKAAERGRQRVRGLPQTDENFDEETLRGNREIDAEFERRFGAGFRNRPEYQQASWNFGRQRFEEARTQTLEGRGLEAARTDRERFRRDIRKPGGLVASMTAASEKEAERTDAEMERLMRVGGLGVMDPLVQGEFLRGQKERRGLLEGGIREQMDEVAPMLAGFRDERETARLQGPSRAALTSSDITTGQGQAELSRLLRGDDPAKDVNLAELRKQTGKFDELIEAVKANNPEVFQ